MANLVTKTVKLPKPLAAALSRVAKQRGCSESELIREGIERVTNEAEEQGIDMVAAIGKSIGIAKGLPPDLSYNRKKYLQQGYGRSRNR